MNLYSQGLTALFFVLTYSAVAGPSAKSPPAAPKSLLIYYGYPSLINGADGDLRRASAEFAKYDVVVLGGGLETQAHLDHAKTLYVVRTTRGTQFFGYIPLGNRAGQDKCHSLKEMQASIKNWAKMGVKGVLLDEFGFDFGVTRRRQNDAVDAAHKAKLRVIANAWNPDDVFLTDNEGIEPKLNGSDIYLWESYRFNMGKLVSLNDWRDKAMKIEKGRKKRPLLVYSVSTNSKQPANAIALYRHQWFCAAIDDHDATGWGHVNFCADSSAPFVASPIQGKKRLIDIGLRNPTSGAEVLESVVRRTTSRGEISVDAEKVTGGFAKKK